MICVHIYKLFTREVSLLKNFEEQVELCEYLLTFLSVYMFSRLVLNPLKPELNPICYLLALLGAHHFLHVSRIRVKLLTLR